MRYILDRKASLGQLSCLLQHLARVQWGRRGNWLWALSQSRFSDTFALQMLSLYLERWCCCPKTSSCASCSTELWEASWSQGFLRSVPTADPLHTCDSGAVVGLPGVLAILLTVLISPSSGFKCATANISNVDRTISFKGQHWSLPYTQHRGCLC